MCLACQAVDVSEDVVRVVIRAVNLQQLTNGLSAVSMQSGTFPVSYARKEYSKVCQGR